MCVYKYQRSPCTHGTLLLPYPVPLRLPPLYTRTLTLIVPVDGSKVQAGTQLTLTTEGRNTTFDDIAMPRSTKTIESLTFLIAFLILLQSVSVSATTHLNLTTTAAANGKSTLECWQLSNPFTTSGQPGTIGSMTTNLGSLANATYSIVPAGTDSGAHNAPTVQ